MTDMTHADPAASTTGEMTPCQRWLALLEGRTPDRVPTDMWATQEVLERLLAEFDCDSQEALWRALNVDRLFFVGATPLNTDRLNEGGVDAWGVRHRRIDYATGTYEEIEESPLAAADTVDEVHAHTWPHPDDFDYSTVPDAIARGEGYRLVCGASYEPFLQCCAIRGMQQAYEDMIDNPGIIDAILGRILL